MFHKILIIFSITFPISHSKESHLDSNNYYQKYDYVPPGQPAYQFNLSNSVFFDRKTFQEIWIYRNGFITLGDALEEDNYPAMAEGSQMFQPFENLVGSNIIAVFVAVNKRDSHSRVRVRQVRLNSSTRNLISTYESKIKEVYGTLMVSELHSLIEIEWLDMKPSGFNDERKNSFRLLLLSSRNQTFGVFEFSKIENIYYKDNDREFPYQSGLRTYSYSVYKLPFYDITLVRNDLTRSSNIGIKDSWLVTVGDVSYNIDMGWPSLKAGYKQESSSPAHLREMGISQNDAYNDTRTSFDIKSQSTMQHGGDKKFIRISTSMVKNNRNIRHSGSQANPIVRLHRNVVLSQETSEDPSIIGTARSTVKVTTKSSVIDFEKTTLPRGSTIKDQNNINRKQRSQFNENGSTKKILDCSLNSCNENEECFQYNNEICCKCRKGASFRRRKCLKNEDSFFIKSNGVVNIAPMVTRWNLGFSLIIMKGSSKYSDFQRAHLTLMSNHEMTSEIRNFLLLLYPLYHIPMAFYSSPWGNETVPNLSSLVDQMAGIHINVAIGDYEHIYLAFRLDRQGDEDKWTISLNGTDMKKLKKLKLANLKLDEKSNDNYNLRYTLLNNNLVDFPQQNISFQDERNSQLLNISWRGTMTFSATCLSNSLTNGKYFVKFSDRSYCNSDCFFNKEKEQNCRVMCLSSPHVFNRIPDPCDGNYCGQNKVCVNINNHYECQCTQDSSTNGEDCVEDFKTTTESYSSTTSYRSLDCPSCLEDANCENFQFQECSLCQNGHLDSRGSCVRKDEYDINVVGSIKIGQNGFPLIPPQSITLYFRQWKVSKKFRYAAYFEIQEMPYSTDAEKQFFNFFSILTPIFDVPLIYFARNVNKTSESNLCSLSKGFLDLRLRIESNVFQAIDITISVLARRESLEMSVTIQGIPTTFDNDLLFDVNEYFKRRKISHVVYMIRDNKIIFKEMPIKLPEKLKYYKMWWSGSGELHKCARYSSEKQFAVNMENRFNCLAKCVNSSCRPYCQAVPILQEIQHATFCENQCHDKARCTNGACTCLPGYAGNGSSCFPVRKTLECSSNKDCMNASSMECRNTKCVCRTGYEWQNNECIFQDKCKFCKNNEECVKGICDCKAGYVRNRISQKCVFDCSVCDSYSTSCEENGCPCLPGFASSDARSLSCDLLCNSDTDCPTHERCGASKTCSCPYTKLNGMCQQPMTCSSCHRQAVCYDNICTCQRNWIGDGINCSFDCSLCFNRQNCLSQVGCTCPSGYNGDGFNCEPIPCRGECPYQSSCEKENGDYRCVCSHGLVMSENRCINDVVQLNILPPGPTIDVKEGTDAEIICFGSSTIVKFDLHWIRRSGKTVLGLQEFLDPTNKTLRLRMKKVTLNEIDQYICGASTGEQTLINLSVTKDPILCRNLCHQNAFCDHGKCKCLEKYIGDGLSCEPVKICVPNCAINEICDKRSGKCLCRTGLLRYQKKCIFDCRTREICDQNAFCESSSGLCVCTKPFIGNGTHCWKPTSSCLLTKRCASNSTCTMIEGLQTYLCICNPGFVGDGSNICVPKMDCATHQCGKKSFCEPTMLRNEFGNQIVNGKCSCEPRFVLINNSCTEEAQTRDVIWMSMGESLISHKIGETTSKIQFIETTKYNEFVVTITALAGSCNNKRLIWSSGNGVNLRSSSVNNFSSAITHLSNLGKVMGISIDQRTGNIFFTDKDKGKVGVIDAERNLSRILIDIKNYSPGPIVAHSQTGKLFWIVDDYQYPRIETADMTGGNRSIFLTLNNRAVSLVATSDPHKNHRLCWMEINESGRKLVPTFNSSARATLKCANITRNSPNRMLFGDIIYKINKEEPFTGLAYFDKKFYWSVRRGTFLKSFVPNASAESKIAIHPNCCDDRIRGLAIIAEKCSQDNVSYNPCLHSGGKPKCPGICVPKINRDNKFEAVCLENKI